MKSALNVFFAALCAVCAVPVAAQTLVKCTSAQGGVEYRNSPCEASQKNAGALKGGAVSSLPYALPPAPQTDAATSGFSVLDKFANPIKAMRDNNPPIDTLAAGECRSQGGFYVEGAGCLDQAPSNRNPAIGEAKMRNICSKLAKNYVKALNDCVAKP